MNKPSAVIDKSLFQEICKVDSEAERESYWQALHGKYQLVVPFVLVEEVMANIAKPGQIDPELLKRMADHLIRLKPYWIDDVVNIAFEELTLKQALTTVPKPSDEVVTRSLFSLSFNSDPRELCEWFEERKRRHKNTAQRWKQEQDRIAPSAQDDYLSSKVEFFKRLPLYEFWTALHTAARKNEMLETILGNDFRDRRPECAHEIDGAFRQYEPVTFTQFPFTTNCLLVRLTYFLAPIVSIKSPGDPQPRKIIKRSASDQANNFADEQYVICALYCDRLLTRDEGMSEIANILMAGGRWKGQTIFIQPEVSLRAQIPMSLS